MSNPTTPFSWQMPTATDLVTDLPADFEVFGQAVATSMADLLGGTTGQILSKTSNTDMDFTWINNDQGDITGVTASSPLTGGGTSGAITVGIQDALTTQKGAVQLSDSTSTTSSILAATPTAVKSAYDLADGAIAKSTVTTAGDIIYRNATVPTRLGIGTAGQVLKVNSGATAPEWGTASGGLTLITAQTIGSAVSAVTVSSVFSSTYDAYRVTITGGTSSGNEMNLQFGSTTTGYRFGQLISGYSSTLIVDGSTSASGIFSFRASTDGQNTVMDIMNPNLAKLTSVTGASPSSGQYHQVFGVLNNTTSYTAFTLTAASGTFTGGIIRVYGYQNS